MRVFSSILVMAATSVVNGQDQGNKQVSTGECATFTDRLYITNPALKSAEDTYLETPAGSMMANCIDQATGAIKGCTGISLGQSDSGDAYKVECEQNADGEMWTYQYTATCTHTNTGAPAPDIKYGGIWQCGFVNCTAEGVETIIPLDYFDAVFEADGNYTCESSAIDIVPAGSATMRSSVAFLAVAVVSGLSYWT